MLGAPGPWYPMGQSRGPGAYPAQPLVELWAIPSPCLVVIAQLVAVVASVKCVRQPHGAGWRPG